MSRGGRGAFRGGGRMKVGGQEVPWDYDPDLQLDNKPGDTFPDIDLPTVKPPTEDEQRQLAHYLCFRARMRDDPLFSVLADDMKVSKSHMPRGARFDPFDGMPTYAKKYSRGVRKVANFKTREYAIQYFPRELWDVIEPKAAPVARAKADAEGRLGEEDGDKQDLEDIKEDEEAEEEGEKGSDEEEEEEAVEDDFSDDDDEMAGDYNAEGYFDTGEGDDDGFGGGGDDGGDGGMYE